MRKLQKLVLIATCAHAGLLGQASNGVIKGIIRDGSGQPVRGVVVVVSSDPYSRTPGRFQGHAQTGADGRYQVRRVSPGGYWVCPQVANGDYLNPCMWEPIPPSVLITASGPRSAATVDIKIRKASFLVVAVRDPDKNAEKIEKATKTLSTKEEGLMVAVRNKRNLADSAQVSQERDGRRTYRFKVPAGQPVRIDFDEGKLDVEHGAPGQEKKQSPFTNDLVLAEGERRVFEVSVKGRKQ